MKYPMGREVKLTQSKLTLYHVSVQPEVCRKIQALRGSFSATFAMLMALCMHVIAGGNYPKDFLPLLLALISAIGLGVLIARSHYSTTRLSITAISTQIIFHQIFSLTGAHSSHSAHITAPASGGAQPSTSHTHSAHSHMMHDHAALVPSAQETTTSLQNHSAAAHSFFDPHMLLAHAAAALMTITVIRQYERIIPTIIELLYLAITPFLPRVRVLWNGTHSPQEPHYRPVLTLLSLGFTHSPQTHRGPPTTSFV